MLADFYITRLSNDMKITVRKNNLGGQILYRNLVPPKKNDVKATPEERNINIKLDKAVTLQYKVNDICLAEHDKVLVATEENKLCQLILH